MLLRLSPTRQHFFNHLRRPSGVLRLFAIVAVIYLFAIYVRHGKFYTSRPHAVLSSSQTPLNPTTSNLNNGFLPLPEATTLCAQHKWTPYPHRSSPRNIYDLIMLSTELDMLEIRLHTMASSVDYFVILESPLTFTGLPKPLILQEHANRERFKQWEHQIIYKVVEDMPGHDATNRTWDREDWQRDAMLLQGVLGQAEKGGERDVKEGDILIVADVDEIVRPEALQILRECEIPRRVTLRSAFYYYSFEFLHRGPEWAHPQATTYTGSSTILPSNLRNGDGGSALWRWWEKAELWGAGWHCSSCFATVDELLRKMESFSHVQMNQEYYRDRGRIVEKVSKGEDLWDRKGEVYDKIVNNEDVPVVLRGEEGKRRFGYMLERQGANGGFTDVQSGEGG